MNGILKILLGRKVITPIVIILGAILFYIIAHKVIKKVFSIKLRGVRVDARRQKTIVGLIDNITKYFIAGIAILMILDVFDVDTKSLLASLGIVSLVIGLALQDLLKDIIAGAAIIFEDQYNVGDVVTIGDFKGTVTYVGIKSTRLKAYTGEVLVIANRHIEKVINHSLEDNISVIEVPVSYASDLDKVKEVLNGVITDLCKTLKFTGTPQICGVEKLADSSVNIRLEFCSDYDNRFAYERLFREHIKKAFDENKIEIPYTQIVIHNARGAEDGE